MKGSSKFLTTLSRDPSGCFVSAVTPAPPIPDTIPSHQTTMSSPSLEEFSELCASVISLTEIMKEMALRIVPSPAPSAPSPAITPVVPSIEFVPPMSLTNVNSASPPHSLCSCFPDIEAVVIVAIITHKFKAANLHKLDPTNHNKEMAYTFNDLMNQFEVSTHTAKENKTPFSVIVPLQHYFCILSFYVNNTAITNIFYQYTTHLLELIAEYEWHTVFNYHSVFFNRRRAEMAAGEYSHWLLPATNLLSKHVYAYRKPALTKSSKQAIGSHTLSNPGNACRNFNEGKCMTNPCPWGHLHICSTCKKTDHGKHQHKD
ncbi:hypothetical protein H0H87_012783 [Tephrocybe sp. NHM501043]|nr:hypothetical protein H0H87_012783 [Tephrocybe sp. NHM501043]